MSLPRESFQTALLDFSMEMPVGFFKHDIPSDPVDFNDPTKTAPLLVSASPIALALFTVTVRPAYSDGSVRDWFRFLADHFGITIDDITTGFSGGLLRRHPAILVRGHQTQEGIDYAMRFVAFEDGGRLISANALCPREIEDSYLGTLTHCIRTLELDDPQGPSVPLEPNAAVPSIETIDHDPDLPPPRDAAEVHARAVTKARDTAIREARPLVDADRFDEAESLVRGADVSILGHVAIASLYTQAMVDAARDPNGKPRALALFRRALHWRLNAYPDPHTEIEAENFEAGRRSDQAELVKLLGFNPDD